MTCTTPVSSLNTVGKALEKRLFRLGIETTKDLLLYFPFRYEDYSEILDIANLKEGMQTTIRGKVELIANKRSPRKRVNITEAVVADDTGRLRVVWFGQPFITKQLHSGDEVFLSGKVDADMFGATMKGPVFEKIRIIHHEPIPNPPLKGEGTIRTAHTARIVPIYPLTAGITQKQIRFLIEQCIDLANTLDDWVPDDIRDQADVMSLAEAVRAIHFPESQDELKHAERRLKFDELFLLQLRAEMMRQAVKREQAPTMTFYEKEIKAFVSSLSFVLTKDQKISAWEILKDMGKGEPMNRLLEGDVGSGKTVVGGLIALNAVLNGYQVAIMAPTEILAAQHFASLKKMLGSRVNVALYTRTKKVIGGDISELHSDEIRDDNGGKKVSQDIITHLNTSPVQGGIGIIVGTHALLSEDIIFNNLGLVIVDEQHRFGVEQRKTMKRKITGEITPHFLSMTATPIPRSFALALYGDLDISVIKEMPTGRKAIKTRVVESKHRDKAYQFIREQVREGRQVFVICSLIVEKDEKLETRNLKFGNIERKSVLNEYEKLSKVVFPDLRVGYLHGKLKVQEKEETMKKFRLGEIDILVSTSVVEVGVDIPNASVMMIEGADRFGLAQLHQFRGRVGRADHQSYCFLFTDSYSDKVKERLTFFESHTSGFDVAEFDLKQRGPGEVYGTTQSGMMHLRLASLRDGDIIKTAREIARGLDFSQYPSLKEKVGEWEGMVHLE